MTFDELLDSLLGPTGIPDRLRAVNSVLNPVEGVGQSMAASRTLFAPETSGMGRVEAAGNMLSGMAGVAAPAIAASRAGVPAANALAETFTGLNMGAQDVGRAVVARLNQPGDLGTLGSNGGNLARAVRSAPQTPAQEVAALLAAGRGAEVTDDLMARVDPQEMWRLYESGATGMDMPMDAASRMGRAKGMGFEGPTYHGTHADIGTVDLRAAQSGASLGTGEDAFWTTTMPKTADTYLGGAFLAEGTNEGAPMGGGVVRYYMPGSNIIPMQNRLDNAEVWDMGGGGYPQGGVSAEIRDARKSGADAVVFQRMKDQGVMGLGSGSARNVSVAALDPSSIRSQFARFDPRLRHLANLSAAGAGVVVGNALAPDQNRHPYD